MAKENLGERVAAAAERALNYQKNVSAIDVLMGMGLLHRRHLEEWRQGRVPYLEQGIQCHPQKLSDSLRLFRLWAESHGLKAAETEYAMQGHGGERPPLHFTPPGAPDDERPHPTPWGAPEISEQKNHRRGAKTRGPTAQFFL